jgi:HAD superfamily hydrolase (TIGR01484 family)
MPLSSPLPPPPATRNSAIRLLSTDFDGTVVNHDAQPAVVPEFFAALTEMRERGVQWAVNTGRVLWHIEEGLKELNFPIEPDYVLTSEREVFHRGADGRWQDFGDWNARCSAAHDELFQKAGTLLADIEAYLAAHTKAHPIYEGARLIGLAAESDDEMDGICAFLEKETARVPGFQFMRNSIYVRFCHEDYSKGTALAELARLTGLERGQIFAAGDHYNDLPMLDGRHARWVACPGNAVDAVKRTVTEAGGYVAQGACSAGILEALRHFGACSGGAAAKTGAVARAL